MSFHLWHREERRYPERNFWNQPGSMTHLAAVHLYDLHVSLWLCFYLSFFLSEPVSGEDDKPKVVCPSKLFINHLLWITPYSLHNLQINLQISRRIYLRDVSETRGIRS